MIPEDFRSLLPKVADSEDDNRPTYFLWSFDPDTGKAHLHHNEDEPLSHAKTHREMAPHIHHPERIDGYAYSIKGGWRITTNDHKEVKDRYIVKRVLDALRGEHPEPPLPHLSYHRIPL